MIPRFASLTALALFRSFFLIIALLTLDTTFNLGTSITWLCTAAVAGSLAGTFFPIYSTSFRTFFVVLLAPYLLAHLLLFLDSALVTHRTVLAPHALLLHMNAVYFVFTIASVSTWLFWRYAFTTTAEIVLIIVALVSLFSNHRDYNLVDLPLFMSTLAWQLGTDIPSLLIMISTVGILLLTAYLLLATSPHRPLLFGQTRLRINHYLAKTNRVMSFTICLVTALTLAAISRHVLHTYNIQLADRGSNGVGMSGKSDKEAVGSSPLGFHSALGSNNQPAALVRLEGDYLENPFSPMLYLREGALSGFDGREMVQAEDGFDSDVPFTDINEQYLSDEDFELRGRIPIEHSVYLLADHKKQFAIDYPVSITPVKNPAPDRFKGAYKAQSIAPAFDRSDLNISTTGDPRWSNETLQHYLTPHPDPRYKELAEDLTLGLLSPAEKGAAIVDHLNKNAIYTLTPNHNVDEKSDPVAPFLFGDLRGYCVHFAHATVYMLRSLGIPARVATGYLTDLSQARDGHILLRMSDRHAWAEMYLTGRGWIPYDTQPEQVESHADTQVDMQLLEELMGLVGPEEELFSKELLEDEPGLQEPAADYFPDADYIFYLLGFFLFLLCATKCYLRHGWRLYSDPGARLRMSYRGLVTRLQDLGVARFAGETRTEYSSRIEALMRYPTLESLTEWYNTFKYHGDRALPLSVEHIDKAYHKSLEQLTAQLTLGQRIKATLNPMSVVSFLTGEGI